MLIPQTLVQTKRLLVRWSRDLTTVIETLVVPILLLLTLDTVLGHQISTITGHDALFGSVPMVCVVATISGSSVGAIALIRERADGLLARLWVLPVHRASGLLSRFVAEAVRILVTTVVILCAGLMLGFRFQQGLLAALAWLMVPVIFGLAFATLVTTAAFYSASTTLVEAIALGERDRHLLLHRFRAAGPISAMDSAGGRASADVLCHRGDAWFVAGRPDPLADDRDTAMGRRHCRGMRCADGDRLSKGEYAVMFPTSVIRKLARSEEMFAQSQTFCGATAQLTGPVDVDAMSVAFDTLLQAHPVLAGHLEPGPDGPHHIVVDDFLHPGIWVAHGRTVLVGRRQNAT